jgi:membrane-associated phospholipid phosphatase
MILCGDAAGCDLAGQLRCPRAELSLRPRHGDLRDHRFGVPLVQSWWKALPWALAAAVCLSRVYLGAHFPLDVIAGAGLGMFIGGMLNLVFGVPSTSSGTAHASGLR